MMIYINVPTAGTWRTTKRDTIPSMSNEIRHLRRACAIVGTQAELARRIKVAPQQIDKWMKGRGAPAEHCPAIEDATGGLVKCEQLNPRPRWHVLRGSGK